MPEIIELRGQRASSASSYALFHNEHHSLVAVVAIEFRLRESLLTYPLTQEPASLIPFHHTQHHPNYPEVRL